MRCEPAGRRLSVEELIGVVKKRVTTVAVEAVLQSKAVDLIVAMWSAVARSPQPALAVGDVHEVTWIRFAAGLRPSPVQQRRVHDHDRTELESIYDDRLWQISGPEYLVLPPVED